MKKKLAYIALALLSINICAGQDISGDWYGTVQGGTRQINFTFHIDQIGDSLNTRIDIVSLNLKDLKTKTTRFTDQKLVVDGSNIGFTYEAKFDANGEQFNGTFKEAGQSIDLVLKREDGFEETAVIRPQEPSKPYPYIEEEVLVENKTDKLKLAGTLTLPATEGPHPAVILISGSGPQNRNEEIAGHKPFLVLADHLTRKGIAVLRYDDRGINKSTGNYATATSADFATDALSAVEFLKTRTDIDAMQIGLIGHSEGGIIAPMVANRSQDVAFMVLLAGTGISGKDVSMIQLKTMQESPVEDAQAYYDFNEDLLDIASSDQDMESKRSALKAHFKSVEPLIASLLPAGTDFDAFIGQQIASLTAPWAQFFYNYNPADELEKVTCPVLSLNGDKDVQVPAEINQKGIRAALEKGKNRDYQVKVLSGLNHLFQEAETGATSEYYTIQQTFSPIALDEITEWLKARVH